jgi:hypothetical protein
MAKAYYSTVFEQRANDVWNMIRDNNRAIGVRGGGHSEIEAGKSGDTVGSVWRVHFGDLCISQRLLAQSDIERFQTYEFCGTPTPPLTDYQSTIRVTPVVDGGRLWNGRRRSIAKRTAATSLSGNCRLRSRNGSNRSATPWPPRPKVPLGAHPGHYNVVSARFAPIC